MTAYPDNEKHWAVLSGECVAALGLSGWPKTKPAEAKAPKNKKTKGKK